MRRVAIILSLVLLVSIAWGQDYQLQNSSEILIKGTSSMHDWESNATEMSGALVLTANAGVIEKIESLSIALEVESIKSGKKKMDKLTYKAFDSDTNPKISFNLLEVKKLDGINAEVVGELTMAGKTKKVEIVGTCELKDGEVLIMASHKIDMTQFGMEEPTAMLGAIKVGKEITVDFKLSFK